ncbi:MAG TPA: hypothetical protein VNJ02_18365 [Vicinamibacterales bacterium]|nr:hypothetical protein [Vicinamibacterales bacterium]
MTRRVLRLVAIAIAFAAMVDPRVTRDVPVTPSLTIVSLAQSDSAARLAAALSPSYEVATLSTRPDGNAAACPSAGSCIVISNGDPPQRLTAGAAVLGGVRVKPESDVVITDAVAPSDTHVHGGGLINVSLRAVRVPGLSVVRVVDDGVVVGETRHEWSGASTSAIVPVEWSPLAAGARRLRITVIDGGGGEGDAADLGVMVHAERSRVLIYEPQATWLGTFVRRALAQDPRVTVTGQTRLAPALAVSRGPAPTLTRAALDDVRTVIVGGASAVSAADVLLLRRFVALRGGSLIVLLDGPPSGPIAALLPKGRLTARRAQPANLGGIRAAEFVVFTAADDVSTVESIDGSPVIASRAIGRGRVIAFGALDAWQHRDQQFGRFWSALVADAGSAAGDTLVVRPAQTVLPPGGSTELTLEWRAIEAPPASMSTSAEVQCPEAPAQPVRMWPTGRPTVFRGVLAPVGTGLCEVRASITTPATLVTTSAVLVTDEFTTASSRSGLDGAIAAHGGLLVDSYDLAPLVARAIQHVPNQRRRVETHAMRSPLWIIPFAACLCAEWWLRRRDGLR